MKLANRVAVITGAGGGIRRATALALARRGCHLALADIDAAAVAQAASEARALGVRATSHLLDVADREAVRAAHNGVDLVATSIAKNARVPAGAPTDEIERGRVIAQKLLRMAPEHAGEIIVRGIERPGQDFGWHGCESRRLP
jgi:NAD(P)-dependent dehydrogenase (short-subunit alcohol dehydrogenase family)